MTADSVREQGHVHIPPCSVPLERRVDVVVVGGSAPAAAVALAAAAEGACVFLTAPNLFLGEDCCSTLRMWSETVEGGGLAARSAAAATDGGQKRVSGGATSADEGEAPRSPDDQSRRERTISGVPPPGERDARFSVETQQSSGSLLLDGVSPVAPLRVKQLLTRQLVDAGVEIVLGARHVGVLMGGADDGPGDIAGVVLATRAGLHAVAAREVVDATRHALVYRSLGLIEPLPDGSPLAVSRVVIGGDEISGETAAQQVAGPPDSHGEATQWYQYRLNLILSADTPAGWAELERQARDRTARPGALRCAQALGYRLPGPCRERAHLHAAGWGFPEAEARRLGSELGRRAAGQAPAYAVRPAGIWWRVPSLASAQNPAAAGKFGRIDSAASEAEEPADAAAPSGADSARPSASGPDLGPRAASMPANAPASAAGTSRPQRADTPASAAGTGRTQGADELELAVALEGFRPGLGCAESVAFGGSAAGPGRAQTAAGHTAPDRAASAPGPAVTASASAGSLDVLATVDVLVVGGGTSGAPAGIAAARSGAHVLVIEPQEALGGIGTVGLITRPYHGLRIGFAEEVPFDPGPGGAERKAEWLRRELHRAGGDVWFGATAFGAVRHADRVCGAAVATPYGHGVVLAHTVIDATGNADLAAAMGAETLSGADQGDVAVQGAGLAARNPGADYANTDFLLVDDSDVVDVTRAALGTVLAADPATTFDIVPIVQSRERRRIRGEWVLFYVDQLLGRTYPDTVVLSQSDYDSHGYPSALFFALLPHDDETRTQNHPAPHPAGPVETPFRALLPCGVDGLLVTGLGTSMHRDAAALVRMQPDLLNQGYAAGLAAARACREGVAVRDIDIRGLQRELIAAAVLPERVLNGRDNFPLPEARVREAVHTWVDTGRSYADRAQGLAVLFAQPEAAVPLLRQALTEIFGRAGMSLLRRVVAQPRGGAAGGAARGALSVSAGPEAAAPLLRQALTGDRGAAAVEVVKVLGVLGQPDGAPLLVQALDAAEFDAGILQGRMAEYAHLPTPVDALILALGYSGDTRVVEAILRKLEQLDAGVHLSHHRAVALALEALAAPQAAAPLAALLDKPGMSGHFMTRIEPLYEDVHNRRREGPLREIVLARALFCCGDHQKKGRRILEAYCADVRGYLARHAAMVLACDGTAGTSGLSDL